MFANLLFLTKKKIRKIHKEVTKLQASKLSKSAYFCQNFFASQTAVKNCLNTGVDYTVLHAIVHADWPVQMLSVANAGSRAWTGRSFFDRPTLFSQVCAFRRSKSKSITQVV